MMKNLISSMTLESIYENLKNEGLKPRAKPIDTYDGPFPGGLVLDPSEKGFLGLYKDGLMGAAGEYDTGETNPYDENKTHKEVFNYLRSLNHTFHVDNYYDCEDRAFWTMAHVRNKFPNFPIGIISGKVKYVNNQEHALIVLWYKKGPELHYSYWDPKKPGFVPIDSIEPGNIKAVIAFPLGLDKVAPIPGTLPSLRGKVLIFDNKRLIYHLDDISEYLVNEIEKKNCVDDKDYYDRALWTFVHVRRYFAGCLYGFAIGIRDGGTSYENIFLYKDGEDWKKKYWNPCADGGNGKFEESDMEPKMVFI